MRKIGFVAGMLGVLGFAALAVAAIEARLVGYTFRCVHDSCVKQEELRFQTRKLDAVEAFKILDTFEEPTG